MRFLSLMVFGIRDRVSLGIAACSQQLVSSPCPTNSNPNPSAPQGVDEVFPELLSGLYHFIITREYVLTFMVFKKLW